MQRRDFLTMGLATAALAGCQAAAAKKATTAVAKAPGGGDPRMRGPFPILSTPYHADGSVDYASLARGCVFTADGGCPGVIWCQSNDAVDLLREPIDNLTFAFVTPLGTDHHYVFRHFQ